MRFYSLLSFVVVGVSLISLPLIALISSALISSALIFPASAAAKEISPNQVGAAQLEQYLPLLENKRVGLVVNQTSVAKEQHIVDLLLANKVNVQAIFAPEHGFRGDQGAGEIIKSGHDNKTGIKIVSIYGKNKRPNKDIMSELDIIVFDIQDVGVRFYTYISSMHYMMQAAAESDLEFVVLDRPNPNIQYVDGPILEDEFRSFVGMHPIPVLHGLTVGELAKMILGEGWLSINAQNEHQQKELKLTVIPVANYSREDSYSLPIPPSPNLPNDTAIRLYPSLCFFEATPVSIGRGTDFPFQVVGFEQSRLSAGKFQFTPRKIPHAAPYPKLEGKLLSGQDLRASTIKGLELSTFMQWFQRFQQLELEFFERASFMDKLAGTNKLRLAIVAGKTEQQIRDTWQRELTLYKQQRKAYLLY